MNVTESPLRGSYMIDPDISMDSRGFFNRIYCRDSFTKKSINTQWVQINRSFTQTMFTVRGMHFQRYPHREIKLIQCIKGEVFDVIIDLRKNSPTLLQWVGHVLSEKNHRQIYVPYGFAHGFQTLTSDVQMLYMHSEFYTPSHEDGIHHRDPRIRIEWPNGSDTGDISKRDQNLKFVANEFEGIEMYAETLDPSR